jgi:two-component system response regulator NreC
MKLILLDPSEVFRIGLWAVLSRRRSDLEILDDAASAHPHRIASLKPDLVVTDLAVEPTSAAGLIARLKDLAPSIRVVVLSREAAPEMIQQVLAAGASGFLPKTMPAQELAARIDRILNGDTVPAVSPSARPSARPPEVAEAGKKLESLSPREREVFDLVIWGCSNKEVAASLSISIKTVETHRGHLNGKLGVRSSADLVRFAAFAGALDRTRGSARPLDGCQGLRQPSRPLL